MEKTRAGGDVAVSPASSGPSAERRRRASGSWFSAVRSGGMEPEQVMVPGSGQGCQVQMVVVVVTPPSPLSAWDPSAVGT